MKKPSILGILIAGGQNTRFRQKNEIRDGGKHLAMIGGHTLLSHNINYLLDNGANEISIVCNPQDRKIFQELLKTNFPHQKIQLISQNEALGVAHALHLAVKNTETESNSFLVLLGDNYFLENFEKRISKTFQNHECQKTTLLFTQESKTPWKHAVIWKDKNGQIIQIKEKPLEEKSTAEIVSGFYLMHRKSFLQAWKNLKLENNEYQIGSLLNEMLNNQVKFITHSIKEPRFSIDDYQTLQKINDLIGKKTILKRKIAKPAIFITGIAGFIGSRLAKAFHKNDYPVFGVDNLSTGYEENITFLNKDKNWWNLDISKRQNIIIMKDILNKAKASGNGKVYVVHLACPAYDANSYMLMSLITESIAVGTNNVIAASIRSGITAFIYGSSMARYETNNLAFAKTIYGYNEDDPIGGMTPYGQAKCFAERNVRMSCEQYGIPWSILVYHNVIGKGQQYNNPIRNVVSVFMNLLLHKKPIWIYGNGKQERVYSPWKDIEEISIEMILGTDSQYEGLILNIGPEPKHAMNLNKLGNTIHRVAQKIIKAKFPLEINYINPEKQVSTLPNAICSHRRLNTLFGKINIPDYEKILYEMATEILKKRREFDYSILMQSDLGSKFLHPAFINQNIQI